MQEIDVNKVKVQTEKGVESQAPAGSQRAVVRYTTETGVEVKLSPAIIKKYLVSGDQNAVTDEELMMFLQLCRFQKLNPYLREAYLIKYSRKYPASLVTGKDVFLKRAQRIKECKGFKAGLILMKDDEVKYTDGLILPDWTLIGGWSEVTKEGWEHPARLEVNFNEYVGKTADGTINRMWKGKPGTMIRKVSLAQNLREVFPEELGKLFTLEEMPGTDGLDEMPVILEETETRSQKSEVNGQRSVEPSETSEGAVVDAEFNGRPSTEKTTDAGVQHVLDTQAEDEMEKFAQASKKIADSFIEEAPIKDTTRKLNVLVGKVMKHKDELLPEHFDLIKTAVETQRKKLQEMADEQRPEVGSQKSEAGEQKTEETRKQELQAGLNDAQIALVQNQMDDLTHTELFQELGVEGWHQVPDTITAISAVARVKEKREEQF